MHSRRQIFVKYPYNQQAVALQLDPAQSVLTLPGLTSLLESSQRKSLSDFCVALDGKPLNGSTRIQLSNLPSISMLTLYPRLRGGGGDGGATGAESRYCYLKMYAEKKPDKVDPNEQRLSKWLNCALSNEPLAEPCVIDLLGNLFNKEALVKALSSKKLPKRFSYIKDLKDMVNIKLTPVAGSDGSSQDTTSAQFQCPISGFEFNGKYKFFALRGCGHVMSAKAMKEVKSSSCLVCHADVTDSDKIVINGTEEEVGLLRERMEEEKAKLREKKDASKKSKNGVTVVADTLAKVAKRQMDDGHVNGNVITVKKFKAGDAVPANATKEMSVVSDSPVHSSSSDDLAAFLETELESDSDSSSESFPSEEAEDEAEVANHRLKRRRLEHLETVEEEGIENVASVTFSEEISEASSSKGLCEHPGSFENICILCGQKVEETGVPLKYIHKGLRFHQDELSRLRDSDMIFLQRQRKLCLVLDLDHTLLNTTVLKDLKPEEEYLKSHTHSLQDVSGGNLFMLEFMHMMTKLRPFVRSFLKEASEMFVMYIYTMGDRQYAERMAKLLDPKGEYFGDRIISRDDGTVRHQKSLDVVLGQESSVLILDDTENAWPSHKDNLIVIERYHFFASSCKQFEHKFQSLSQLKSDESEPDGVLATVLKVLKQTHSLFFEDGGEDTSGRDVRSLLKQVRKEVLKGCKVVFSRVFPNKSQPEHHPLWRIAEGLGATCATEVDATVTHVVAMDVGTEKVRWAIREKKFVVHRGWIDAAHYLWKKQPEENFGLEQLKKQGTEEGE